MHHGGAWATDVPNGLARVWQGSLHHGGAWATDVPNGLARESSNLTAMDWERYGKADCTMGVFGQLIFWGLHFGDSGQEGVTN